MITLGMPINVTLMLVLQQEAKPINYLHLTQKKFYDEKNLQTRRVTVTLPNLCFCAKYQRNR